MTGVRCAIDAVQAEVAHALDHHRVDDLLGLFTADAVYVTGGQRWAGAAELRERFEARARDARRVTRHVYSALRLTDVSETTVRTVSVWSCYAANSAPPPDGVRLYMVADFDDVFTRCPDGRWRIAARTITPVFREPALAPGA